MKRTTIHKITPERDAIVLPIAANLVLVIVAAAVFWAAFANYREQIRRTEMAESRFITLEWNLLRELKSETDRLLHKKDQEILALRLRYLELASQSGAESERREVEDLLRQAERERELIVLNRLDVFAAPADPVDESSAMVPAPEAVSEAVPDEPTIEPPVSGDFDHIGTTGSQTILEIPDGPSAAIDAPDEALIEQIATMERMVEHERDRAAALAREVESLTVEYERVSTALDRTVDELQSTRAGYERLTAELRDRNHAERLAAARIDQAAEALTDIEFESRAGPGDPASTAAQSRITMEHVGTRALVRAILASQPIRAGHPDLPEAFESYIGVTENAAVRRGRRDAYLDAVRAVEAVQRRLGLAVPDADDPDAAYLFQTRLLALVEAVLGYAAPPR